MVNLEIFEENTLHITLSEIGLSDVIYFTCRICLIGHLLLKIVLNSGVLSFRGICALWMKWEKEDDPIIPMNFAISLLKKNIDPREFIENYYRALSQRTDLGSFYHPDATLIFDGFKIRGRDDIVTYLRNMPADLSTRRVQHLMCSTATTGNTAIVKSICSWEVRSNEVVDYYHVFHIGVDSSTNLCITHETFEFLRYPPAIPPAPRP